MNTTKTEYQRRLKEVEIYLETVRFFDKGLRTIECTDINGDKYVQAVNEDLVKILKANGFLILYNLIEATIRNSIVAILNSIEIDMLPYRKLSDKLKRLWLRQEINEISEKGKLMERVEIISRTILDDSLPTLERECVNISGNIDAQKIRDIAKQFGYDETKDGRQLVIIKDKRNILAHGEYTFSDVGKDYTYNELVKLKDETVLYIEDVLDKVELYINNKGYLSKT